MIRKYNDEQQFSEEVNHWTAIDCMDIISKLSMLVVLLVMNHFITLNESVRPTALLKIVIDTVVGGIVYVVIAFKSGLMEEILGRQMLTRLVKKFTFGLVKLKDAE